MNTPMSPAQLAQQNNRDSGGRYATRIHSEQDRFEAPAAAPEPMTVERFQQMDADGTLPGWLDEVKSGFDRFQADHLDELRANPNLTMFVIDVNDFILRAQQDRPLSDPAFVDGTDDRIPHYLNVASRVVAAGSDGQMEALTAPSLTCNRCGSGWHGTPNDAREYGWGYRADWECVTCQADERRAAQVEWPRRR